MGKYLSFIHGRKTTEGYAKVRTGLGKSDRPGSQGGLWKRELYVLGVRAQPGWAYRAPTACYELVTECHYTAEAQFHLATTRDEMGIDDSLKILAADAISGLRTVPSDTIQVALTSPPFYLLRRYGTSTIWPDGWKGELGHEQHPNDFVRHLVQVFDEVWRVLRDDGCLWVNLADTFNNKQGKKGTTNAPDGSDGRFAAGGRGYAESLRQQPEFFKHYVSSIGHKSEMGVPFRFHLAMTDPEFRAFIGAHGGPQWICRRTVIWAKSLVNLKTLRAEGNAMPEPTRDRPSRNYEFLFLFSKQPNYYFDRTAIDVPSRAGYRGGDRANAGSVWETQGEIVFDSKDEPEGLWRVNSEPSPYRHVAMWPRALVGQMLLPTTRRGDTVLDPFAGSGTTGEVALDLGLKAILIESSAQCREALADRLHGINRSLAF